MGAEELKYAAYALGKISGKVDPEEILGLHPVNTNIRSNIRRLLYRKITTTKFK